MARSGNVAPLSAAKVFIVRAEHFSNPGLIVKAFSNRAAAEGECVKLVDIMVNDMDYTPDIETDSAKWEKRMEWLQDYHGAQYCYCEIDELPLNE
jgi:hypothetical protein